MDSFLEYSSIIFLILAVALYLFKYNIYREIKAYRLLCVYLVFLTICQVVSGTMAYFDINNSLFSHIYFIGEFLTLSFFFHELLLKKQRRNAFLFIIVSTGLLVVLLTMSTFGLYKLNTFDPLEIIICALPIIVFSIIHLYNSLTNNLKFIYLTIGIIMYKTISAIIFILLNFANTDLNEFLVFFDLLWRLNAAFVIIYYILLIFEWFKNFRLEKVG